MMGVRKNITILVVAALFWCCNGDGNLLDLYPMEPIVNPEVGMLIGDNRIIHIDVDGRQRISGITEKGVFATVDRFRSFDFESHAWQAADGAVGFGNGIVVHTQTDGASFALRYSMDDGRTWAIYSKPIVGERFLATDGVSVVQLLVSVDRSVWLLCQQDVGSGGRTLLYRTDLEQEQSTLVMEKTGATAVAFGFSDPEHGWVLYGVQGEDANRVQVLRTADGGQVWTDGAVLDGVVQPAIEVITADDLLIYDREGAAFHSTNGGVSFKPVMVGSGRILASGAASAGVVYALLENGVAKSTDGGQTWLTLDALAHGIKVTGTAVDFHSERAGIVYGADRLFMTNDGGQSWDVLVYPYDYVFGDADTN